MNLHETAPEQSTRSGKSEFTIAVMWVYPQERLTTLPQGLNVIGRSDDCQIHLPGDRTSRRHASIEVSGPLLVLRDEGSRNGTKRNGERISTAPLAENDVVRIGDWIGVVLRLKIGQAIQAPFIEPVPGVIAGPQTQQLWEQLRTVASSSLPVVVEGETGTGKEVVAQALHHLSRRGGAMVAVNCAALPESLAEAQLFGHSKGAFTGAHAASIGYFGAAHEGTLFLDELPELPLAQQAKLLRAVEDGSVTPVGTTHTRKVQVRLIAATQRPLWQLASEGRFRADLHARLSGMVLKLPPLRQRREEVPRLFRKLLDGSSLAERSPKPSFVEALCLHNWPLNVRELVQAAHRAKVLLQNEVHLSQRHLGEVLNLEDCESTSPSEPPGPLDAVGGSRRPVTADARSSGVATRPPSEEAVLGRRRHSWLQRNQTHLRALLEALERNNGNVSRAAREVGISRQRAHRLLEAHTQLTDATSPPPRNWE